MKIHKIPVIFQNRRNECGIAALRMLFLYYGVDISQNELRKKVTVGEQGCSAKSLIEVARQYLFDAQGIKIGIQEVLKLKCPCIMAWNSNHFVVYLGEKRNYVYYNDPCMGKRKITMKEFSRRYRGICLIILPNNTMKKRKSAYKINNEKILDYFLMLALVIINLCSIMIGMGNYQEKKIDAVVLTYIIICILKYQEQLFFCKTGMIKRLGCFKYELLKIPDLYFAYEQNGMNSVFLIKEYGNMQIDFSFLLAFLIVAGYHKKIQTMLICGIYILIFLFVITYRVFHLHIKSSMFLPVKIGILFIGILNLGIGAVFSQYMFCISMSFLFFLNIMMYHIKIEFLRALIDQEIEKN